MEAGRPLQLWRSADRLSTRLVSGLSAFDVVKGSGPDRVGVFAYAGHPTGLMRQKEVESGPEGPRGPVFSRRTSASFSPLRSRRSWSSRDTNLGRTHREPSQATSSSFISIMSASTINCSRSRPRSWSRARELRRSRPPAGRSDQQVKDWMKSGSLIEHGVRDCIASFVKEAQAAGERSS